MGDHQKVMINFMYEEHCLYFKYSHYTSFYFATYFALHHTSDAIITTGVALVLI